MKGIGNARRKWRVAGLMAMLALGLAPGKARADRDGVQAETAEFNGVVNSLPGTVGWIGDWTIDGRKVRVDPSTRIEQEHGQPAVGVYVEVKAQRQTDGSFKGTKIEVKRHAAGS